MLIKSPRDRRRISDKMEEISLRTSENMQCSNFKLFLGDSQEESSHLSWPWELQFSTTNGTGCWRVFLALSPRHSRLKLHLPLGNSDVLTLTLHLLLLVYAAYFLAACILDFQRALALFVLTCLVLLVLLHHLLKSVLSKKLTKCLKPFKNSCLNLWMKRWVR